MSTTTYSVTDPETNVKSPVTDLSAALTILGAKPSQIQSLRRVISFWEGHKRETNPVAHEVNFCHMGSFISLTVWEYRTDCPFGSIRHAICSDGGHYFIRQRGAIEVVCSYQFNRGTGDSRKKVERGNMNHLAKMVGGTVRTF